jgi:two-component system chemotaxis response regulator CheY
MLMIDRGGETASPAATPRPRAAPRPRRAGILALVVDDDPVARSWLGAVLTPHVGEIVTATDGDEAWALLAAGLRPAVCVADVVMERVGGLELLRQVRADPLFDDLPFILVSVAAQRDTVGEASAHQASAYLLKPFFAAQARCVMAAVVRECRLARAEHFLLTLRRLGLDLEALDGEMRALRAALLAGPATDTGLAQLRSAARRLGLNRCAGLLDAAAAAPAVAAGPLLREAAALVQEQREQMDAMFDVGA